MEGSHSNCVHVDSGIPQGTVLGPLLFLCHIDDLPLSVDSKIRLFADDWLIYRDINYRGLLKIEYNFKKTARKQTPNCYQLNGGDTAICTKYSIFGSYVIDRFEIKNSFK